ncbi:site-specific integrase [Pseudomonas sp. Irchel 3E13]|jgi:integrase|uniref:site-specific integrase n=1 Tax=Pseudomonas sp. Irchel 3E13 TaxID=2008975 RepID=UPI001179A3EE|nr:site-specific integrase [Pseudomonas sp. Irchel 3E13]
MRSGQNRITSVQAEILPCTLPSKVRTKGGVLLDPSLSVWSYQDGLYSVSLDFSIFDFSDSFMKSFRLALIWFAEHRSPTTLSTHFRAFKVFTSSLSREESSPLNSISKTDVLVNCDVESFITRNLVSLLRRWYALGYPGIDEDVIQALDVKKLRRRELGRAVLTWDEDLGPFTAIEQESVQDAVAEAYGAGLLSREAHVLTWLFIVLGARPIQIAGMKVCDVVRSVAEDGTESYLIYVPRAKQQSAQIRQQLKPRALIAQIGRLIFDYSMSVKKKFVNVLSDPLQAPLFPNHLDLNCNVMQSPSDWSKFHRTSESISKFLVRSLERLSVRSERTGKAMNLCALRFRRTMGTNIAREGHGILVIAELLDHSRTDTAAVYVAATPELAIRIDKATALHMAPLAQAFKGQLIDDERQAVRGLDRSSRIIDLRVDQTAQPMGSCGSYSFCGLSAPLACYTCQCFQPWLDGPHEAVLEYILKQNEGIVDERIASINDRTVLAVAQVVQLCRQRKSRADE